LKPKIYNQLQYIFFTFIAKITQMPNNKYFSVAILLFFLSNNFVFAQNKFIEESNRRKLIELKKELDLTHEQETQIVNILKNTKYSNDEVKRINRTAKLKMKESKIKEKTQKKAEKKRIKEENKIAKKGNNQANEVEYKLKNKPKIIAKKESKKVKEISDILVYREDQRAKIQQTLLPDQKIVFLHLVQRKIDSIKLYQMHRVHK
jgi:hypothetical protein